MLFVLIFCWFAIGSFILLLPNRTNEMLDDWQRHEDVEILKAIPIARPWTFKWGLFSQAHHFVGVLVRDVRTEEHFEMVLRLGGYLLGLKAKRVKICETRPVGHTDASPITSRLSAEH